MFYRINIQLEKFVRYLINKYKQEKKDEEYFKKLLEFREIKEKERKSEEKCNVKEILNLKD